MSSGIEESGMINEKVEKYHLGKRWLWKNIGIRRRRLVRNILLLVCSGSWDCEAGYCCSSFFQCRRKHGKKKRFALYFYMVLKCSRPLKDSLHKPSYEIV
jgi:hypothetical protein